MSSDTKLRQDIEAELDRCANVDSRQIGVSVKNGIVALTGRVGSYVERHAAEETTQSIAGVKAVANDLTVQFPFGAKHSDADIAAAAVEALKAKAFVSADHVKVVVRDGCIELQGHVNNWQDKTAAEAAMMPLHGLKSLINNLFVQAQATASGTLDGEAGAWREHNQARIAAWQPPGVSQVADNLTVRPERER